MSTVSCPPLPRAAASVSSSPQRASVRVAALVGLAATRSDGTEASLLRHLRALEALEDECATGALSPEALREMADLGHRIMNEVQLLQLHDELQRIYVSPSAPDARFA